MRLDAGIGARLPVDHLVHRLVVPIAFVTGFAESEQLEDALGPDVPILRKPFGTDELGLLVAQLLDREGAADA